MAFGSSSFVIITNVFYVVPLIIAYLISWSYLAFLYFVVIITSTLYHICENADYCSFGWDITKWRMLDHITAWYGITMTLLYCFNQEYYLIGTNMKPKLTSSLRSVPLRKQQRSYVSILEISSALILVEIVYVSIGAIDSTALSSGLVFGTLIVCVLTSRLILYFSIDGHESKKIYKKSFLTYTKHHFHVGFFALAMLMILIAFPLFLIGTDVDYIGHGLWHQFGAIAGCLLLLSVYC